MNLFMIEIIFFTLASIYAFSYFDDTGFSDITLLKWVLSKKERFTMFGFVVFAILSLPSLILAMLSKLIYISIFKTKKDK